MTPEDFAINDFETLCRYIIGDDGKDIMKKNRQITMRNGQTALYYRVSGLYVPCAFAHQLIRFNKDDVLNIWYNKGFIEEHETHGTFYKSMQLGDSGTKRVYKINYDAFMKYMKEVE